MFPLINFSYPESSIDSGQSICLDKAVEYADLGLSEIVGEPAFGNLHDDPRWLPFLTSIGKSPDQLDALKARGEVLTGVNPVLFSQEASRSITPLECRHISGSHVYRRPPDELPVLDEMLETGRFDLLQDQLIKENLRSYVLLRERARAYYDEAVNELFRLHSRYPSLITVTRVPATPAKRGRIPFLWALSKLSPECPSCWRVTRKQLFIGWRSPFHGE